jgi:NAD(P)-dependent dehydrogenase (short-subunit alcohol dehydrogenase family)
MTGFTATDIPDLADKLFIVTGANSGTGLETARVLAARGAEVVAAARNPAKAQAAIAGILRDVPGAQVRFEPLDLDSLGSVADFAGRLLDQARPIDGLVNNAGVMALSRREVSADGFERQFATNYLGHFALTARLLPLLSAARGRTVQVSSTLHRQGRLRLEDLNYAQGYAPWPVYAQSKLAMLMFALELDRRSRAHGWGLTSVAAHPGYARTNLIENGPLPRSGFARFGMKRIYRPFIEPLISHSAAAGALPILLAATAPDVRPGGYYGPTLQKEMKGPPGPAAIAPQASDEDAARGLWEASEAMTGVSWSLPA